MSDGDFQFELTADASQVVGEADRGAASLAQVAAKLEQLEARIAKINGVASDKIGELLSGLNAYAKNVQSLTSSVGIGDPEAEYRLAQGRGTTRTITGDAGVVTARTRSSARRAVGDVVSDYENTEQEIARVSKALDELAGKRAKAAQAQRAELESYRDGLRQIQETYRQTPGFGYELNRRRIDRENTSSDRMSAIQDTATAENRRMDEAALAARQRMFADADREDVVREERAAAAMASARTAAEREAFQRESADIAARRALREQAEREDVVREQRAGDEMARARTAAEREAFQRESSDIAARRKLREQADREDVVREQRAAEEMARARTQAERMDFDRDAKLRRDRLAQEKAEAEKLQRQQERDQRSVSNRQAAPARRFDTMLDYAIGGAALGAPALLVAGIAELDAAMHQLQAISGATNTDMGSLRVTIEGVAQASKFSTLEIAQAATTLAQAGYTAQEMGKLLRPVVDLAAATGSSTQQSAETLTSVLTIWNKNVSESADVANIMSAALNQSKLSLTQLQQGLQLAGNVAADAGIGFVELTAAVSALSNAGVRSGSMAGTGIRQLVIDLQKPTEKATEVYKRLGITLDDLDVQTHGFTQVLDTLRSKGFSAADAFQAFETRSAASYIALQNQSEAFKRFQTSIVGTDAATQGAATTMASLEARAKQLGNTLTIAAAQAGGPLLTALGSVFGVMTELLSVVGAGGPALAALGTAVGSAASAMAVMKIAEFVGSFAKLPALLALTTGASNAFAIAMVRVAEAEGTAAAAGGVLTTVMEFLAANPVIALALAIGAVVTVLGAFGNRSDDAAKKLDLLNTSIGESKAQVDRSKESISQVNDEIDKLGKVSGDAGGLVEKTAEQFAKMGLKVEGTGWFYRQDDRRPQRFAHRAQQGAERPTADSG